jgi:hypothetical protein
MNVMKGVDPEHRNEVAEVGQRALGRCTEDGGEVVQRGEEDARETLVLLATQRQSS